jgi:hypothetical protein
MAVENEPPNRGSQRPGDDVLNEACVVQPRANRQYVAEQPEPDVAVREGGIGSHRDTPAREVRVQPRDVVVGKRVRRVGRTEIRWQERQAGMMRCEIEQGDLATGRPLQTRARNQLPHRLVEPHLPHFHHACQHQTRERLGHGCDPEDRARRGGPVREHSPRTPGVDADGDAPSGVWGERTVTERTREIAIQHGLKIRRSDRGDSRIEREGRYRVGARSGVQCCRPDNAGRDMEHEHRQAQRRADPSQLGQKDRVRADRQRRENEHVAMVREQGGPAQHREDAHHQHRRGDQEMFDAPREHQPRLRVRNRESEHWHREQRAQEGQQRDQLEQQLAGVSGRVR